jgi:hypothetical protein
MPPPPGWSHGGGYAPLNNCYLQFACAATGESASEPPG